MLNQPRTCATSRAASVDGVAERSRLAGCPLGHGQRHMGHFCEQVSVQLGRVAGLALAGRMSRQSVGVPGCGMEVLCLAVLGSKPLKVIEPLRRFLWPP